MGDPCVGLPEDQEPSQTHGGRALKRTAHENKGAGSSAYAPRKCPHLSPMESQAVRSITANVRAIQAQMSQHISEQEHDINMESDSEREIDGNIREPGVSSENKMELTTDSD